MTRLRIRVKNAMYERRDRYGYHIPEFNEYEGEVVPNPKWVGDDSFCLSTGNASFPFRVIAKEAIECGWQLPSVAVRHRSAPETRVVEGSNGKKYVLTKEGKRWACNCTGYSYRKTCSHVKLAEENVDA